MRYLKADAQGRAIKDYLSNGESYEVIERSDGYLDYSENPRHYFAEYHEWNALHKEAIMNVSGRILDLGCGADAF